MEQSNVFVSFFLDASRPHTDGKCLIKLNIYDNGEKKRYPTPYYATKEEWEKLNGSKLRDEDLKSLQKKLTALKAEVQEVVDKIQPFSFVAFEQVYQVGSRKKKAKPANTKIKTRTEVNFTPPASRKLEDWFNAYYKALFENDQVGTAGGYNTVKNSLNDFRKNLMLQDVTPELLKAYEDYIISDGNSLTTVNIYMRALRAILNLAIKAKLISKDNYPFGAYEIPTGENTKKSLSNFDISALLDYEPTAKDHKKALDFWIYSYLCNGMNFADIINLKPTDVSGNYLSFYRQKTIRTKKKDLRKIRVGLNPRAIKIMERWKNTNPENPYLFPILEAGLKAKTIKNRCQRFIKWVNKNMYEICAILGIEHKAGTYAARHTFSTVLKRKGAPISYIKDSLGHSSVLVTEAYLGSFEDETLLDYANELTNFKKTALKVV